MAVGVVGALGAGAAFSLVGNAGAAPSRAKPAVATPVSTATFNFSVSVSGLTPSAVIVTGNGQVDFTSHAVSLTATLPGVVAKLLPGGSSSPEVVNAVLSDGTVYLEVPSLRSLVGEPWISVALPTTATSAVSGGFAKVASALGDVNVITQLAKAHHATVTPLTTTIVNGVSATGDKVVASLRHGSTLTASVWADASNRLVQAQVTASVGAKGRVGVAATVNVGGYGAPVTISAPPASQVTAVPLSTVASVIGKYLPHAGHGHHRSLHALRAWGA